MTAILQQVSTGRRKETYIYCNRSVQGGGKERHLYCNRSVVQDTRRESAGDRGIDIS